MADGQTPQPQPTSTPAISAPNFDSIPGHQIHDESTIGPETSSESLPSQQIRSVGMIPYTEPEELQKALDHVTSAIENYTQEGRAQHPILSRLGDATRAAKEYLEGGKAAGQPMGTEYGVATNPVTQVITAAPGAAEDAAKAEAAIREYGPKIAEHLAETGRTFKESIGEDVRSALHAKAPEGSAEAGKIPIGKPKPNFDKIRGHKLEQAPEKGNPQVVASAQRYNVARGRPEIKHEPLPLESKENRNAMADAYDALEHNPNDPRVKASYDAMKRETKDQFNHIVNDMGIKIDFTPDDPYKNAEEMQADVRNNHHLSVFTGGESQADHPASEIDPDTGQTYQNLFRATHDIFGHAAGGFDFSELGENSAFGAHRQMYSSEARPAVQHETQGQANWFFNNSQVRNGKPLGDFPPQKAAVLPENFGKPAEDIISPIMDTAKVFGDEPFTANSMKLYTNINNPEEITKTLDYLAQNGQLEKIDDTHYRIPQNEKSANADITESQQTATAKNALQKLAQVYPPTDDASQITGYGGRASFITPDGKFMYLDETHPDVIAEVLGNEYEQAHDYQDVRIPFINESGVIRTRFSKDKAGDTLHVSVPPDKVTPEQVDAIKRAVAKVGRYGNLVMETATNPTNIKTATQEFATPRSVDEMLTKIGAHPEDWSRKASQMAIESPAGAINPRNGEVDKTGFGVEVYPEARADREPLDHAPTTKDLQDFYDEHREIFSRHPELRVGWDKTDKGYELNIGASGSTQAGAELVGRRLGQRAAWDIEKSQEVPTGGTGEKTKFGQYSLEDRINDLTGRNVAKLPPTIRNSEHLTDEEKHLLGSNDTVLRDFKKTRKKITSTQELAETMKAGEANRFWYDRAKKAFDAMFDVLPEGSFPPEDRNKFISLVAATSPRVDVTENLASALNAYRAWVEEGRPSNPNMIREAIDSSLMIPGAHGPNAARALTNQPLSGPKVTSFQKNFMGSAKHVTNDMWGAITNGIVDPSEITSPGAYMALSENYRKAAASLGWTPQQGQAASWGFIRTLGNLSGLGGQLAGKERPAAEIVKMIDDPLVQKYSADIAEIMLTNQKVRDRIESLGVNLDEFDTKLNKYLESFGRSSAGEAGRPNPKYLAKSAQRVEDAKAFAREQAGKGKKVNEKALPLLARAKQ